MQLAAKLFFDMMKIQKKNLKLNDSIDCIERLSKIDCLIKKTKRIQGDSNFNN